MYNGYQNYETWLTVVWISSNEFTYKFWTNRASEILEKIDNYKEARYLLEKEIQDTMEEYYFEDIPAGLKRDLLYAAFKKIDFSEVAESLMEG